MADHHSNDGEDKLTVSASRPDAAELKNERQVDVAAVQTAESKRTNASDGSVNKLALMAAQEASLELKFGDTTISRRNILTESQLAESQLAERSDGQLLAQAPSKHLEKQPEGPAGIAAHASDQHHHHAKQYKNHGDVYTCAMFVNHALADAGYKLHYDKGDNHNMVHSLNHSLSHDKRFSEVKDKPYQPHVGDIVILGDHHSGVITSIGKDGPMVTYGGSTQTGSTGETPLKILENSPGFAGPPTHVYRVKNHH